MNQNNPDPLALIKERMEKACRAAGRNPDSVRLVAVSKTHPGEAVLDLYLRGQRIFAESYADEGVDKISALGLVDAEWHYIGPVQSNKTRMIAEHFDWVQSVDRLKIVRRLDEQRPAGLDPLQVLIQVNLDDEPQKAGCTPDEIASLAERIGECRRLKLRGLMAIPAPRGEFADQKRAFEHLHALYRQLQADHAGIDTLSAGMSADLEAAIAAGSTMVRVGTALFGPRNKSEAGT